MRIKLETNYTIKNFIIISQIISSIEIIIEKLGTWSKERNRL